MRTGGTAQRNQLVDGCGCFPTGGPWPGLAGAGVRIGAAASLLAGVDPDARWTSLRMTVIDVETTGLDPIVDRVVEVGVARIEHGEITQREGWLANPGIAMPEESLAVHGLTDEALREAPPFGAIAEKVAAFLEGALPVAYNAEFDAAFLREEFRRAGATAPAALAGDLEWLDPLVWLRDLQKGEKGFKLTEVAARMNIPLVAAHRAGGDAEAAGRVLLALAPQMPTRYVEVVRRQRDLRAAQEREKQALRASRGPASWV